MGSCCSTGRSQSERAPVYFCRPPVLEQEPFPSTHNVISGPTSGIFIDTNLDTSSVDTYLVSPAPLPHGVGLACSQASPVNSELDMNKNAPVTSVDTHIREGRLCNDAVENSIQCEGLKKLNDNGKFEATAMDENESTKCSKPVNLEVEEDCPICLEEYNIENPKMFTKCEHHFHLCCLLEWMERSDVCPMCDQVVTFSNGFSM